MFFFKIIYNPIYTLYIIKINRYSKLIKRFEFAIKSISNIFLSLCYSLVKRFQVKFTKKLIYLTLSVPLPNNFCEYSFNKVIEKGSYFREPSLYKVDKYFEKAS